MKSLCGCYEIKIIFLYFPVFKSGYFIRNIRIICKFMLGYFYKVVSRVYTMDIISIFDE